MSGSLKILFFPRPRSFKYKHGSFSSHAISVATSLIITDRAHSNLSSAEAPTINCSLHNTRPNKPNSPIKQLVHQSTERSNITLFGPAPRAWMRPDWPMAQRCASHGPTESTQVELASQAEGQDYILIQVIQSQITHSTAGNQHAQTSVGNLLGKNLQLRLPSSISRSLIHIV